MSTRCTIGYGEGYHLYEECFDQDKVWLELDVLMLEDVLDRGVLRLLAKLLELELVVLFNRDEPLVFGLDRLPPRRDWDLSRSADVRV